MTETKRRFEATCKCGGRITGDTIKWRHEQSHPKPDHKAQPIGPIRQI